MEKRISSTVYIVRDIMLVQQVMYRQILFNDISGNKTAIPPPVETGGLLAENL
jgi:hypothetical protein